MACLRVALPDGGTALVCTMRRRRRPCVQCGAVAPFLCDAPVGGGLCSRPLCGRCRIHVPPGKDFCRAHRAAAADAAAQLRLFEGM